MKPLFALLLVVHGAIHLLGSAKGFGLAELPQLAQPISRPLALAWLTAALLFLATAAALWVAPRWWWAIGAAAIVVSQGVIATAWRDARFGTVANVIALVGVVVGSLLAGPTSARAAYAREVARTAPTDAATAPPVTEADLTPLPEPVQRWLRYSGAVGRPRVRRFRVHFHGRIRGGPDAAWMAFTGEQVNGYGPSTRLFLMDATMKGLPVQAYHRFVGRSARMDVTAVGLARVAAASGPVLDRSETVTLLNDMCVFAPEALLDADVRWTPVDARRADVAYTREGITVRARLVVDDAGALVDFVSDDRAMSSPDGRSATPLRWSTPLHDHHDVGGRRLMRRGAGVWHAPAGPFTYLELVLDSIAYEPPGAGGRT